jgi:hypothetical protein
LTSVCRADLDAYGRDRQCAWDSTLDEFEFPESLDFTKEGFITTLILDEALDLGSALTRVMSGFKIEARDYHVNHGSQLRRGTDHDDEHGLRRVAILSQCRFSVALHPLRIGEPGEFVSVVTDHP